MKIYKERIKAPDVIVNSRVVLRVHYKSKATILCRECTFCSIAIRTRRAYPSACWRRTGHSNRNNNTNKRALECVNVSLELMMMWR